MTGHTQPFWTFLFTTVTFAALASSIQVVLENTKNHDWHWIVKDQPGLLGWERKTEVMFWKQLPRYTACDVGLTQSDPQPNSWLISDQIAVSEANRIDITIEYRITSCSTFSPTNGGPYCVDKFDLYVNQSDKLIADTSLYPDPLNNAAAYEKVADIKQATNVQTFETINVLMKGTYVLLAFQNYGSCNVLYSVKVTYNICPDETLISSFVALPRTVSPANHSESIRVEGYCNKDAVQQPGSMYVYCKSNGQWNISGLGGKCVCKEDMQNVRRTCEACLDGKYNDQQGFNCTILPSAPRNVTIAFVNQSTVEITWVLPEITGDHTDVYYDVECRKPCDSDKMCVEDYCKIGVSYIPYKEGLNAKKVIVADLSPFSNYTFKIYAKNRVSEVAKRRHGVDGNFTAITVRTNGLTSSTTIPTTEDSKTAMYLYIAYGCAGFVSLLIVVVVSFACYTVIKRRRRQKRARRADMPKTNESTIGLYEDVSMYSMAAYQNVVDDICHDFKLDRDQITLVKLLGAGNFGQVSKAIYGASQTEVAVKTLKDNASQKDLQDMLSELDVMKSLQPHSHVVKLIGCCIEKDPLLIVLEYLAYGDLLGYLRKSRGIEDTYNTGEKRPNSRLTEKDLLSFAWMIADGMNHLATMKVVHRDLAARNVLVGENKVCKISDFGLARGLEGDVYTRSTQARLPVKWMPPESLFYGESSTMSDIWSYGIVMWEVFTIGESPYPGVKSRQVADLLQTGYRMPRPRHISEELYSIMTECWEEQPHKRPTFQWLCSAVRRLLDDKQTYVNLEVYDDKEYVNFDVITEKD
ncbi:hypothetical protein ACROYT_G023290 [Oculina patagonica]